MRFDKTRRLKDCGKYWRRYGKNAFTLVELLIVITIMAIIIAIAVGIGKYVMAEGARKRTQSAQAIIIGAIDQYMSDNDGDAPADGGAGPDSTIELMKALKLNDKSWNMMAKLDKEIFSSATSALKDGWGSPMIYDNDGGYGGKPIIISVGPDGDPATTKDNIRSDKK